MLINRNCNLENMYINQHTAKGTHVNMLNQKGDDDVDGGGEDEERFLFTRNLLAAIPMMEVFRQIYRWCKVLDGVDIFSSLGAGNQEEEFDGGIHTCCEKLVA